LFGSSNIDKSLIDFDAWDDILFLENLNEGSSILSLLVKGLFVKDYSRAILVPIGSGE